MPRQTRATVMNARSDFPRPAARGVFLWLVGLVAVATSLLASPPASASSPVLLIVGDSLSAGYGIRLQDGWASLLQQRLRAEGFDYEVVNASISGDTTEGGRSRIAALLERHQPAVVVVELGGNDGLRGLSLGRTGENLGAMVEVSLKAGAKVLLLGVRLPPNYGLAYISRFARMYESVAAAHGVPLVPRFLEGVADDPALMQSDGIHPTAQGQPLMLETVWPTLEQVLRSRN